MKYKVTLNNRVYEVEVEEGSAMLIDEYGKMTAKSGGIGLRNQIMTQLLLQQEADTMTAASAE